MHRQLLVATGLACGLRFSTKRLTEDTTMRNRFNAFACRFQHLGWLVLAWFWLNGSAHADSVQVAVAASFSAPMQQIAANFERDTGHKAQLSFGSTGKFYAQIKNGAPFDMLLAADDETPAKLEQDGGALNGTRFTYAVGKLVLWSPQAGMVDTQGEVLKRGSFERIALANPKLAPYGAASIEVMTALGVQDSLRPKFVLGENLAQAYQFIASGNAALGFLAAAQVMKDGKFTSGAGWIVPAHLHTTIRQDAVILLPGKENKAASALLDYLKTPQVRSMIRSFGYDA
jgi:molybdate transport system substrate-binding protein